VFVGVLLVVAEPVRAEDERQRQTLAGLRGVSIVVEDVNPDAERTGSLPQRFMRTRSRNYASSAWLCSPRTRRPALLGPRISISS